MAGWHTCCICKGHSYYRCLCCPVKSVCLGCLREADFVQVGRRQTKGLCANCLRMAIMIENNVQVDSDGVTKYISFNPCENFNPPSSQVQIPLEWPLRASPRAPLEPPPYVRADSLDSVRTQNACPTGLPKSAPYARTVRTSPNLPHMCGRNGAVRTCLPHQLRSPWTTFFFPFSVSSLHPHPIICMCPTIGGTSL